MTEDVTSLTTALNENDVSIVNGLSSTMIVIERCLYLIKQHVRRLSSDFGASGQPAWSLGRSAERASERSLGWRIGKLASIPTEAE